MFKFFFLFTVAVWGTDVEIFAATILLNTSIYTYMTEKKTWQLFNKTMGLNKPLNKKEKCIYIKYIEYIHYEVVTDVE